MTMAYNARTILRAFFENTEDDDYLLMTDAIAKCNRSYGGTRSALECLQAEGVVESFQPNAPRDLRVIGYRRGPALKAA